MPAEKCVVIQSPLASAQKLHIDNDLEKAVVIKSPLTTAQNLHIKKQNEKSFIIPPSDHIKNVFGKIEPFDPLLDSTQILTIENDHLHPEHDVAKCRDKILATQPHRFVPEMLSAARNGESRHFIMRRYKATRYKPAEQIAELPPRKKISISNPDKAEVRLFSNDTYRSYKSFDTEPFCDDLGEDDQAALGLKFAPARLRSIADELKALNLKRDDRGEEPKTLKSKQHEESKTVYRTRAEARRREFEAANVQYRADVPVHIRTKIACQEYLEGDGSHEEVMQGITRADIARVLCDERASRKHQRDGHYAWLNDEIINAYLKVVVQHALKNDRETQTVPSHHAFNSFFYKNLAEKGPHSVVRWAKRAKIGGSALREVDKVFVPINTGNHWYLVVVEPKKKTLTTYNSMGTYGHNKVARDVLLWVGTELGSHWFIEDEWTLNTATNSPQQRNGNDCGVFTLCNARQVMLGQQPGYGAEHIPDFRYRIIAELVAGGLLRKGPKDPNRHNNDIF